jgi:hypothetical protein
MADGFIHAERLVRSREKGSIERHPTFPEGWCAWKAGKGYVSQSGGFTKHPNKALVVSGPGEAIRLAAVHGFAITSW